MKSIHISTARHLLNSGDPDDILCWLSALAAFEAQRRKNSDGSILSLHNVISLRYDFYGGWRNVKILSSGEIRRIRDCLIFSINNLETFL